MEISIAETPEITIAVRIANGYGSSNATSVGRDIFNYYFGLESQGEIVTGEASQALNTRTDQKNIVAKIEKTNWEEDQKGKVLEQDGGNYEKEKQFF